MIIKLKKLLRNNYFANKTKQAIIYLRFRQEKKKPITTIFTDIFHSNEWKSSESISGTGSVLKQTEVIRRLLPELIKEFNIQTILDAPCGDYNWMRFVELNIKKYVGADIVEKLITRNNRLYSNENRQFVLLDLTKDILPESDLLFCRDCLVHLSYTDIRKVINNFKSSKIKYVLTTTFTNRKRNIDIPTGSWRPINLQKKPFNLPTPIYSINEQCTEKYGLYNDKSIALWRVRDL